MIIALSFDIEENPGPKGPSPKRCTCNKTVRWNQEHLVCKHCFTTTHVTFLKLNSVAEAIPHQNFYTCVSCLHRTLPFFSSARDVTCNDSSLSTPDPDFMDETSIDRHLAAFENKPKLIKVMHLNPQSLVSNFNQINLKLSRYHFDVVAHSETWLKAQRKYTPFALRKHPRVRFCIQQQRSDTRRWCWFLRKTDPKAQKAKVHWRKFSRSRTCLDIITGS